MKKSTQFRLALLATGVVSGALFSAADAPFTAGLPVVLLIGVGTSLALIVIALQDYAQRPETQPVSQARVLRPGLPAVDSPQPATGHSRGVPEERSAA